ncbi:MAG: hypothetical protein ACTHM6_10510 [Tepidisphaeraceae bacterium]
MTLGDAASLIVAFSDLMAVEAVTKAINANLPHTGPLGTIPQGYGPGTRPVLVNHAHDNPQITPRLRAHPAPRIEARQTVTPAPRRGNDTYEPAPATAPCDCVCEPAPRHASPIPPIWKNLPPVAKDAVIIRPKVIVQKVDVITKGTLIDLFL